MMSKKLDNAKKLYQNGYITNIELNRYKNEADIDQALILAGGLPKPIGDFEEGFMENINWFSEHLHRFYFLLLL